MVTEPWIRFNSPNCLGESVRSNCHSHLIRNQLLELIPLYKHETNYTLKITVRFLKIYQNWYKPT